MEKLFGNNNNQSDWFSSFILHTQTNNRCSFKMEDFRSRGALEWQLSKMFISQRASLLFERKKTGQLFSIMATERRWFAWASYIFSRKQQQQQDGRLHIFKKVKSLLYKHPSHLSEMLFWSVYINKGFLSLRWSYKWGWENTSLSTRFFFRTLVCILFIYQFLILRKIIPLNKIEFF